MEVTGRAKAGDRVTFELGKARGQAALPCTVRRPGALAAQHLLRHKNRKQAFQLVFRGTVALNLGALIM